MMKYENLTQRVLPVLFIKTIFKRAAAFTRASSSWDCALYDIVPDLLHMMKVNRINKTDNILRSHIYRSYKRENHLLIGTTVLQIAIIVRNLIRSTTAYSIEQFNIYLKENNSDAKLQ